jgi:glycosyltransferase involved in cell wall biosynthesis
VKIAIVVPGGVDRSGEQRVIPALLALIRRLTAVHEVHVFALAQEASPGEWLLCGARIRNIGAGLSRLRAVRAILREHRVTPFDLVHSIWSGAPGMVAVTAARFLGIPSVLHIAGVELIALHDIECGGRLTFKSRVREALVLRSASLITAASAPIVALVESLGCTAVRVPLGVDLTEWRPLAPRRRERTRPARLIHVASLNRVKDQPTLLRALAVVADAGFDFQLDVVGEDTLGGTIQALAGELGLTTRVRFLGFQTQAMLRPLVESADLMIISSRHEAGPIAMLEAAAVGVPTVGTCVGHIAEWAPSAAVCVAIGDWNALAQSIRRLLEHDELRLRIAHNAAQRATAEDADHTAARFQALYAQLLDAR